MQFELFDRLPLNEDISPMVMWKGWKKKVIDAFAKFSLAIWNDRKSVVHGTSIDHPKQELISHVHQAVTNEYACLSIHYDFVYEPSFGISKK